MSRGAALTSLGIALVIALVLIVLMIVLGEPTDCEVGFDRTTAALGGVAIGLTLAVVIALGSGGIRR